MAAAISGNSQLLLQYTSGIDENQIRYSLNYAMLPAKGPSHEAPVATPLMRAMQKGCPIIRLRRTDGVNGGHY